MKCDARKSKSKPENDSAPEAQSKMKIGILFILLIAIWPVDWVRIQIASPHCAYECCWHSLPCSFITMSMIIKWEWMKRWNVNSARVPSILYCLCCCVCECVGTCLRPLCQLLVTQRKHWRDKIATSKRKRFLHSVHRFRSCLCSIACNCRCQQNQTLNGMGHVAYCTTQNERMRSEWEETKRFNERNAWSKSTHFAILDVFLRN